MYIVDIDTACELQVSKVFESEKCFCVCVCVKLSTEGLPTVIINILCRRKSR